MITPPHAPSGVRSEFGFAADLIPGALFRIVDDDEWFVAYDTLGCACGGGPWECAGCRGEHEVLFGRAPTASYDNRGYIDSDHDSIRWEGLEEPPEVEFILNPTPNEKSRLLAAPSKSQPCLRSENV